MAVQPAMASLDEEPAKRQVAAGENRPKPIPSHLAYVSTDERKTERDPRRVEWGKVAKVASLFAGG
jgi:hypothetical protein